MCEGLLRKTLVGLDQDSFSLLHRVCSSVFTGFTGYSPFADFEAARGNVPGRAGMPLPLRPASHVRQHRLGMLEDLEQEGVVMGLLLRTQRVFGVFHLTRL